MTVTMLDTFPGAVFGVGLTCYRPINASISIRLLWKTAVPVLQRYYRDRL